MRIREVVTSVLKAFVVTCIGLAAVVLVAGIVAKLTTSVSENVQAEEAPTKEVISPRIDANVVHTQPVKQNSPNVLILHSRNTYTFRGVVTEKSVSQAQQAIFELSKGLKESDTIYLVLDTPGGDVVAGMLFIDSLKALPQRVKTVTIFAASMGFQIVENMDERLILPSGTLMSHRARLSGVEGQLPGELNVRINFYHRMITALDVIAAQRMGLSLQAYQALIHDEYWTQGSDAVADKAADRTVLVRCSADLMGAYVVTFHTIFGPVDVTFSKCPMITGPLKIDFSNLKFSSEEERRRWLDYQDKLFKDRQAFVRKYIVNEEYRKIMPK